MSAAAIVTSIGLVLLTVVLAGYLLALVLLLRRVDRSLVVTLTRLRAVSGQVPPLAPVTAGIGADVDAITATLRDAAAVGPSGSGTTAPPTGGSDG